MTKLLFSLGVLSLVLAACSAQNENKQTFGTADIDHEAIAIDFMRGIEKEDYDRCYDLLSQSYRAAINREDFRFRMRMLHDLAAEEAFYHYHTTFIGKTAQVSQAMLNGEEVTTNIMPEYDFTLKSESESDFKSVRIFLRFEDENSDKISVINYAKHTALNEEAVVSTLSDNPFIVGSYILVATGGDRLWVDVRGGELRRELVKLGKHQKEVLIEMGIDAFADFISKNDTENYSMVYVKEQGSSSLSAEVRKIAGENGFSVFNHGPKELKTQSVSGLDTFIRKYKEGNWNPVAE